MAGWALFIVGSAALVVSGLQIVDVTTTASDLFWFLVGLVGVPPFVIGAVVVATGVRA